MCLSIILNYIYYCDYFSQLSGKYYAYRGGNSTLDLYCGAFNIYMARTDNDTRWNHGASISFKQIYRFLL